MFHYPDTPDHSQLGGKGTALARLGELGFEIPAWFAVPPNTSWTATQLENAVTQLGPGP
ncbi:MAG: hypothetical protein HC767_14895, partial [Akkermansiaceae bacterium]|nr:hypothetical protein [Akkermansiaceae bacterium]